MQFRNSNLENLERVQTDSVMGLAQKGMKFAQGRQKIERKGRRVRQSWRQGQMGALPSEPQLVKCWPSSVSKSTAQLPSLGSMSSTRHCVQMNKNPDYEEFAG